MAGAIKPCWAYSMWVFVGWSKVLAKRHWATDAARWGAARPGDWVRRMRFWNAITRGVRSVVGLFLGTHALRSKARSPNPATMPYGAWSKKKLRGMQVALALMSFGVGAALTLRDLHQNRL